MTYILIIIGILILSMDIIALKNSNYKFMILITIIVSLINIFVDFGHFKTCINIINLILGVIPVYYVVSKRFS